MGGASSRCRRRARLRRSRRAPWVAAAEAAPAAPAGVASAGSANGTGSPAPVQTARTPVSEPPPISPSPGGPKQHFSVEGYLGYQGAKFVDRFDANAYVTLTRMLDSHDVGRERGGVEDALASIRQPVLVVGITSDVLYPLDMQRELVRLIPAAALRVIDSHEGHDAFLLEVGTIGKWVADALDASADGMDVTDKNLDAVRLVAASPQRMLSSTSAMREALVSARAAGANCSDSSTTQGGLSGVAW